MSGHVGGQIRTLPFTGFTALPFVVVGLALSVAGAIVRKVSTPKSND